MTPPNSNQVNLLYKGSDTFTEKEIIALLGCEEANQATPGITLEVTPEKIQAYPPASASHGSVFVDFNSASFNWRKGQGELINRATGALKKPGISIIDATAGLGVDAFILASAGATMTLIEQNPTVYLLLYDGLARAAKESTTTDTVSRITLLHTSFQSYIPVRSVAPADVIYLDPMYPHTGKSARSSKGMQLLQELTHADPDGDTGILDLAIQNALYRVVVKRPVKGKKLDHKKPSFSLKGRSTRFDIYTNKSLSGLKDTQIS